MPDPQALKDSFSAFLDYFFPLIYGRPFRNRKAFGRLSYNDTIIPALEAALRHDPIYKRLYIASPPRYGKTTLVCFFIAWALAKYPKSNFIYASYGKELSVKQTKLIKQITSLPQYNVLFGIHVRKDFSAAENFGFNTGGEVFGAGAEGGITGRGAGVTDSDEFGGCIIIDDIHKPMEVTSDKYRGTIKEWFGNTLVNRVNNPSKTPIIMIAHRLHEDDLPANLMAGTADADPWTSIVLPALDDANIALMPDMHDREQLLKMQEIDPYNFASQYQQNPIPAGGALFRVKFFEPLLDEIPDNILFTFITADTAETKDTWNDQTVFSFWGVYKIKSGFQETDVWGLHWIDCWASHMEPRELRPAFQTFWTDCLRFPVKPQFAAIEKKSTGVTLLSELYSLRGLEIRDIERSKADGNKSSRYIDMQKYIAQKRITLHKNCKHASIVIEHMSKITANDSHRHDDIADTCYDAVKLLYIDNALESLMPEKPLIIPGYRTPSARTFGTWQK